LLIFTFCQASVGCVERTSKFHLSRVSFPRRGTIPPSIDECNTNEKWKM